ncbi:peptidyl-trna hydrolase [Diaporthe amygdali]|uniref:peptidyl-trna hydrolase n=1 Tax=Phomopsis amygdali TaxID=1214568 RepID=UPI0022FECE32|nr:peptidyl-trna hydrolase [Diaporthe amygdali]KAJ0108336.1 peptidyl-trna hydrolase [Diaporthe amygdali]
MLLTLTSISPSTTSNSVASQQAYSKMATEDTPSLFNPRFLVISLGNPAPHTKTLHSAGHLALQAVQQQLHREHGQPSFSSERIAKTKAQISVGDKYTLLQCPTFMNVSGPFVAKAWKALLATHREQDPTRPLGLVIVNDDLEEDLGAIKVQKWEKSHRGHNGMRSIKAVMNNGDYQDSKWARVSVGIGRPEARDAATVSNYVLKPWSEHQEGVIYGNSGPGVLAALNEIEEAWGREREGLSGKSSKVDSHNQPKKAKKQRPSNKEPADDGIVGKLADAATIAIMDP